MLNEFLPRFNLLRPVLRSVQNAENLHEIQLDAIDGNIGQPTEY